MVVSKNSITVPTKYCCLFNIVFFLELSSCCHEPSSNANENYIAYMYFKVSVCVRVPEYG